jgi:ParB-like chromosome segregation protein Spo0J
LGLDRVPCIRLTHMTDAQRRAYILADNRIALNSGWDDAMLALELQGLETDGLDLGLMGFDEAELQKLLQGLDLPAEAPEDFKEVDENIETDHECPKCGYKWSGGQ